MNKILYYNSYLVPYVISADKTILSKFLSDDFSDTLFNQYQKFGLNKHNAIYDRSGYLPHYLNIDKSAHPMPKRDDTFNLSFFETVERRCKELIDIGKPIKVLWSGGIDSTFILFMLHYFANDKSQIKIYGTYNSILESGDMFDRKLKHMFDYEISVASGSEFKYKDDSIYVSGMGGNQLFGPTDNMFSNSPNALFHHTFGNPKTIYEPFDKNIDSELLEFFDPMIRNSPKKLETVADLRWYCIFNLDWYTTLYEHKTLLEPERMNKIFAFFDTIEFQNWAIHTKEPFTKIKGDPNTHRWQMREILSSMFGEVHYSVNKPKVISNFGVLNQMWMFLLSNGENITG